MISKKQHSERKNRSIPQSLILEPTYNASKRISSKPPLWCSLPTLFYIVYMYQSTHQILPTTLWSAIITLSSRRGNHGTTVTLTQDTSLQRPCPNHQSTLPPLSVLQLIKTGIYHNKVRRTRDARLALHWEVCSQNSSKGHPVPGLGIWYCAPVKATSACQRNGWFEGWSRKYTRWAWSILQGQKGRKHSRSKIMGYIRGTKEPNERTPNGQAGTI